MPIELRIHQAGFARASLAAVLAALTFGCATQPADMAAPAAPMVVQPPVPAEPPAQTTATPVAPQEAPLRLVVQDDLGIRVRSIRLASAGHMLDFRYRVVDAEKATPLLARKIKPYLVEEATGTKLGVPTTPKLGQLRTTERAGGPKVDRDLHVLFANPGRVLQPGAQVSLVVGDMKLAGLTVQ